MLFIFAQPVLPPGHLQWFSPPIWGISLSMGRAALWRCWSCSMDSGSLELGRDSRLFNGQSRVRWVPRSELLWWKVLEKHNAAASSPAPWLLLMQGKGEGIIMGEKSHLCLQDWTRPQNYGHTFRVRGEKKWFKYSPCAVLGGEQVTNKNS